MVLEIMLDKNLFEKAFLKRYKSIYKPEVIDNLATFTAGILKRTDHEKTSA